MSPAFRLLFPNQVIRADGLARAMVDVALQRNQRLISASRTVAARGAMPAKLARDASL